MKTNFEWRLWGERDPLWAVSAWKGRQKDGANPWTDEEFYKLGEDWKEFSARWDRYGGPRRGVMLEIGCGAGRITNRLAAEFSRVIAADVSDAMLKYAKARVPATNIDWKLSDGARLPAEDSTVDAAFSCHVLQHFENSQAQLDCFREIYRVLRPGATFMIHIPLHAFPPPGPYTRLARLLYGLNKVLASTKAVIKREMMRRFGTPFMRGLSYELDTLFVDLQAIGFRDVEFVTFHVKSNDHLHSCALGTKPH